MNHNDTVQRNEDWYNSRIGIPTPSRFKDVLTKPKAVVDQEAGKLSQTARSYALDLLAEQLTGERKEFSSAATDWGNFHEAGAVDAYQELTGNNVLECGFVKHQTIATGASPDGLIGIDGGIEVKCPFNSSIHLNNVLTGQVPPEYYAQIQGQIWVCNLDWVDFVSYDPRINSKSFMSIVRVMPDLPFIDNLEKQINNFNKQIEEMKLILTDEKF